MKANEHTPGSESSARGKRHTATPSPQKALAGGGKRDPRVNPKVGDMLRDRSGQTRVLRPLPPGHSIDLKLWRKAMRGAEVVHRETRTPGEKA